MNPNRKLWNQQQKTLRQYLAHAESTQRAIDLFLGQHAMVHSAAMSQSGLWSFEDEILEGISGRQMRTIPKNCEHSIAWLIWHMTRIEDVTMNLLLAGSPQVMAQGEWIEQLEINMLDTGNAMTTDSMAELNAKIDLEALREYRMAVGRQTREIVKLLKWEQLKEKVDPTRLRQIMAEGAVVQAAYGLLDYWGGLTQAGLLLMPPTRHNFVHLNEAMRIKQKIK